MNNLAQTIQRTLRVKSPYILSGFAVAGVAITGYWAAKGTNQASETIKKKGLDDAPLVEKAKEVWPSYIPAVGAGAVTIGCIIFSTSVHGRRAAAAVSAYAFTETAFSEYRAKVREEIGEHREQTLRDDIVRKQIEQHPASEAVIIAGSGNVLCCELYTRRYFMSDMETLRKAQNDVNSEIMNTLYVSLSSFYDLIELPHTAHSSEIGWDSDKLLELEFSTVLSDDNRPCLAFNYNYIKPI